MVATKELQPAPAGVGWGTTNTPAECRIDCSNKHYRTRAGLEVRDLRMVLHNSAGREVTFPIKGSIDIRTKPHKRTGKTRAKWVNTIWTLDGRNDILEPDAYDLVEVDHNGARVQLSYQCAEHADLCGCVTVPAPPGWDPHVTASGSTAVLRQVKAATRRLFEQHRGERSVMKNCPDCAGTGLKPTVQ